MDGVTYTEIVVYKCAASTVSWIRIRRNICGPDELYDAGKAALISVEGVRALVLVLGATVEEDASDELDASVFLVLATRDGLRCILLSITLFCCTGKGDQQEDTEPILKLLRRTLRWVGLQHCVRVKVDLGYLQLPIRC